MRILLLAACCLMSSIATAGEISGQLLDGAAFSVNPADRPIVVAFWASWCGACRREMPALLQLQTQAGDRLRIVGISIDTDREAAQRAATASNLTYPNLHDPDMAIADRFGVDRTPMLLVIARDGQVLARGHSLGRLSEALASLGITVP